MTYLLEGGHIPGGERDPDPVDLGLLLDSFPFLELIPDSKIKNSDIKKKPSTFTASWVFLL